MSQSTRQPPCLCKLRCHAGRQSLYVRLVRILLHQTTSSLTKLVVETVVGARAVRAAALRDSDVGGAIHRGSDDAHNSREGDKTGCKGDHDEYLRKVFVEAIRVDELYLIGSKGRHFLGLNHYSLYPSDVS